MKIIQRTVMSVFAAMLLATAGLASATGTGFYLAGLGLHEETGRNIYLGALYLPENIAKPADLTSLSGTRIMEYRIVARRTSIRSLLGGMLLQSEVATGNPPSNATTEFADLLLSNIKGSLYAGDSLAIITVGKSNTVAKLNGIELARVLDPEVADYILMGWVSESGPTTVFRQGLAADEVDAGMRSILEANSYSKSRKQEIASWVTLAAEEAQAAGPEGEESTVVAQPGEAVAITPTAQEPQETVDNGSAIAAATTTAAVAADATSDVLTEPAPAANDTRTADIASSDTPTTANERKLPAEDTVAEDTLAEDTVAEDTVAEDVIVEVKRQEDGPQESMQDGVQSAALIEGETLESPAHEPEVFSLDVQEYSRRLATFHGGMVNRVYSEIKYPKRAVRRNLEGRLELDLLLKHSGQFVSISISQSSGHKLLDDAALKAAQSAFSEGVTEVDPVAVAEFGNDEETLLVPIPVSFKLSR